jgi:hypothetical protein
MNVLAKTYHASDPIYEGGEGRDGGDIAGTADVLLWLVVGMVAVFFFVGFLGGVAGGLLVR